MRRSLGAALALLAALTSLTPSAAEAAAPDPVRIMIIGDSVAQGSSGDWTWRYRLWQTLTSSGVPFDLVGPHDDLFDVATYEFGSQAYADPAFDRDHAARWGMALAFPDVSMTELMTDYQPDVVIETRGYNDLTWLQGQPSEVLAAMADEVAAARVVDPSVEFVLGQLPQVWKPNVSTFNAELPVFAAAQSQPGSRVVAAATGSGFVEGVDTWDLAHYAATGEVKFAAGIADALAGLGVGTGAGAPPTVVNGHWGDAALAVAPGEREARLSWTVPPGAPEQVVWSRDLTSCTDWARLPVALLGTSWDFGGLAPGHRYEIRLQAAKGSAINDGFSNVVWVVPTGPADPSPRLGCAPTSLAVTPGVNRLTVGWAAVPTASSYDVTWASDVPGDGGTRNVSGGPVVLAGLVGGRQYRVSVQARNDAVGAGAAAVAPGTPAMPAPGRPGRVVVKPGSHRLDLSWAPAPGATSYDITWTGRELGMRGSASVTSPAVAITHVLAGERYDVTVIARNASGAGPVATAVGVPRGPRVAPPARLRAEQIGAHRAMLTWRPRPAASSYEVQVRRRGHWAPVRTVVALTTVVRGLPRGTAAIRVRSWHQLVPGAWSHAVRIRMR